MESDKETIDDIFGRVKSEARLTATYIVFMALSGVLAAAAFLVNSVPTLIGAMVVAPAFPPLALVSLAISRGELGIALRAAGTEFLGLATAVAFAGITTWLLGITGVVPFDQMLVSRPLLEERVRIGWYSFAVAVAAGIAGNLAKLKDKTDTLIGTLASLALVPAGAAGVICLVAGDPVRALGGFALLFVNLSLIVAMGLLVNMAMNNDRKPGKTSPLRLTLGERNHVRQ